MKIVLLPGLDGTGDLFAPLLSQLKGLETQIISLPCTGPQDYGALAGYVMSRLPDEPFTLVAESFSGPIAAKIASKSPHHLKGIVFVATFLSPPNKILLLLSKFLPLKFLANMPLAKYLFRLLLVGREASDDLVELFLNTVRSLSSYVMKARLNSIQSLAVDWPISELPAVYILPSSDKLMPASKSLEFKACFTDILIKKVEGPHFLLQANPVACARIVSEFTHSIPDIEGYF